MIAPLFFLHHKLLHAALFSLLFGQVRDALVFHSKTDLFHLFLCNHDDRSPLHHSSSLRLRLHLTHSFPDSSLQLARITHQIARLYSKFCKLYNCKERIRSIIHQVDRICHNSIWYSRLRPRYVVCCRKPLNASLCLFFLPPLPFFALPILIISVLQSFLG